MEFGETNKLNVFEFYPITFIIEEIDEDFELFQNYFVYLQQNFNDPNQSLKSSKFYKLFQRNKKF